MNYIIILYIFFLAFLLTLKRNKNPKNKICENISHGCGLFNNMKYTNSLEAFENSYRKGYRNIEIDLSVTYDQHIVGAHDWNMFKKITHYTSADELNYTYITKAKILYKYHTIYDYMIYNLLTKYKDVYIITDKITNYSLLRKYSIKIDRLFIEVPNFEYYCIAKKEGFKNVMLSVYNENGLKKILLYLSNNISIFGIVVGPNIFYFHKSILSNLFKKNIKIYVYDINNTNIIKNAACKYVSGFYID